jgi:hypothetical protein
VVDEAAVAVEEEDFRRALRAERTGDLLALVVEVVEVEALLPGADLHRVEGVLGIAVGVVRADRDEGEAARAELALERVHPPLPGLHVRAVVAGLDERERGHVGVVGECVGPSVHSGQLECGCGGTDRDRHGRASSSCSRVGTGDTRPSGRA